MYLRSHFLTLFILLVSFSSCFGSYQDGPLYGNLYGSYGQDPRAYTASKHTIHSQEHRYEPELVDSQKFETRSFGPKTWLARASSPSSSVKVVNVDNFGAKGDGGDDTQAFRKAWKVACSSKNSVLVVPKHRTYHLKPITFSGPCKSYMTLKVYGTIKASTSRSDYQKDSRHWLVFEGLQNFRVEGGGIFDGNGKKWWENSCKINKANTCSHAPTAVTFLDCNNLRVANLWFKNAQQMHLSFQKCVNVKALNLLVTAPGDSPNTDGIHVTGTQNIQLQSCVIRTGDDCISVVSGSENVRATDITCGPGHGISIGGLGAGRSTDYVSNVIVNGAKLSGTTNGVRIKTWQGGKGYARNIVFQNIMMNNVSNPIIIDQYYCDQIEPSCTEQASAVKVSSVFYRNIRGSSASEEAIKLNCSKSVPCQGILLQDVHLVRYGDGSVTALCESARLTNKGQVTPEC